MSVVIFNDKVEFKMPCLYGLKETDGLIWWELRTAG